MGEVRALLASLFVALAIVACTTGATSEPGATEDPDAEAQRVPDPPPRYKPLQVSDASPFEQGDGSSEQLVIRCGRDKPYVCPLDDGTFACSSVPCLPDCTRIGCLGGETCTPCDGGYRCLSAGESC